METLLLTTPMSKVAPAHHPVRVISKKVYARIRMTWWMTFLIGRETPATLEALELDHLLITQLILLMVI